MSILTANVKAQQTQYAAEHRVVPLAPVFMIGGERVQRSWKFYPGALRIADFHSQSGHPSHMKLLSAIPAAIRKIVPVPPTLIGARIS